ncbi:TonB-dependent receptor plug domain-containing protein [Chitinivibrio alkaliphilus]|uniref:TonB-dependent receptor n=1 Tax=Chitinivibrio alkaliphilus ACht1 TaxID=1313304 RepID=U7D7A3_9BACT|nr:TonB-dependent receptor plug domain-containing protein [Chitinivibrio alkaliphilus]ERP30972.1 TonB-dependent receptor [Chitinivibrio alkaliphilus ACht1]
MRLCKKLKPRMKHTVLVLASIFMLSIGSIGAQPGGGDLDLSALLSIVVETGTFLELDLDQSPVTMTLIDSDRIRYSGARNLSELLEVYVPGFQYMINKWNGVVWGMRGVTSDRNDKIIVLINGRKQNLQHFHGFATEYTLGLLGDIDRVEVLRGPAGLVYGSGAIAGVVNIVTKTPEDYETFASGRVEMNEKNGFYGTTVEGAVFNRFEDGSDLSVYVGAHVSDGHGQNSSRIFGYHEDYFGSGEDGVPAAGSPWATDGNYLASAEYSYQRFNFYTRLSRQITPVGEYFPKGYPEEGYHWATLRSHLRDNMMVGADYSWDIGEDEFSLDGSIIGATNTLYIREGANADGLLQAASEPFSVGERRYEITAKYLMRRVEDLQVAYGIQYGHYDIGENLAGRYEDGWGLAEVSYDNWAFFTEAYYDINEVLSAGAGARYDKHTRTDGVWSPKAALVVTPNERDVFKFIVQSSSNNADALTYEPSPTAEPGTWTYEEGMFSEWNPDRGAQDIYQRDEDDNIMINSETGEKMTNLGNIQAPVSYVDPESSVSFEIATNHSLTDRLSVASSASYNILSDLFMWNGARFQTENVGEYDAFVLEGELAYTSDRLNAGINGALMMPLNVDTASVEFERPFFEPVWNENLNAWVPTPVEGEDNIVSESSMMADQVSDDGRYFNSLHTGTVKTYIDWSPMDFLTLHTDARLFFGLWGREGIQESFEESDDAEFLGVADPFRQPIAKWNTSAHFDIGDDMELGLFVYDILGQDDNIHSVRWQQMAAPRQAGLFTTDQRTFAIQLKKFF